MPQYYLKGFATPRSKDGKLCVFDLKQGKSFTTRPRNVASRRDYHRVEIDGVDPNIVENQLAVLDGHADKAFRRVIAARSIASRDDFSLVLTLLAQVLITNPGFRDMRGGMIRQMGTVMMHNMVLTPERWAAVTEGAAADPSIGGEPISFEDARGAVERGEIEVVPAKENLIGQEWQLWAAILPLLEQRQWTLMIAPPGSRGFVTSDRPYALRWSDPALREGFYPPGLGCDDTNLTFPLSRDLALVGRFDASRETVEIDERMVASINLMTFSSAMTQLYADGDFSILEPGETVGAFSQSELWRRVREAPRATSAHAD